MTYRVAIAISGAVSLGSYEAGTLYEIIKALKEHNENPANPKIEIDVLTGASAGGMTAAMIAQKLLYDGDALSGENTNVAYEAWVKKNMYGKEYYGVFRKTYLIDEEGKIQRIWPKVDVKTHSKEIIDLIKN